MWIHGLGDTGDGWRGAFRGIAPNVPGGVKFYHPTAPQQRVTCNGGARMTSWFDIDDIPVGLEEKQPPIGMDETVERVHKMLADIEAEGIPANRIVLGGFSQGGTTSLLSGLTYPRRLAGIVSVSGWAAYRDELPNKVSDANKDVPFLFTCGVGDPVVGFDLCKASGEIVQDILGDSCTVVHARRGMHQPDSSEMSAIGEFMVRCLSD